MIELVTGDLFDPAFKFDAICHGVNCKGSMGAGIAPVFKQKYPLMYNKYHTLCMIGVLLPGQVFPWNIDSPGAGEPSYIYNIASQYYPGADAKLKFLEMGLRYVRFHAEMHNMQRVGLPRIGAGIGGLRWTDVVSLGVNLLDDSPVQFTFVSLEGA